VVWPKMLLDCEKNTDSEYESNVCQFWVIYWNGRMTDYGQKEGRGTLVRHIPGNGGRKNILCQK